MFAALARSFALEMPLSWLLAPLLFYLHTTLVLGLLPVRVTPWISRSRNSGETLPLRTLTRRFRLPGTASQGDWDCAGDGKFTFAEVGQLWIGRMPVDVWNL